MLSVPAVSRLQFASSVRALCAPLLARDGAPPPPLRCVVAVSGGPDSMGLLRLLWEFAAAPAAAARPRPLLELCAAVTVDHALRAESRAEAEAVGAYCRDALGGLPHEIRTITDWRSPRAAVPHGQRAATGPPPGAVQLAARERRYAALADACRAHAAPLLFLAHTADDQSETLLLRWARASGLAGLACMQPLATRHFAAAASADAAAAGAGSHAVTLCRPLLGISKRRMIATCQERGVPFVTDPSNANAKFDRVRVRQALAQLAPPAAGGSEASSSEARVCSEPAEVSHADLLELNRHIALHAAELDRRGDELLAAAGCAGALNSSSSDAGICISVAKWQSAAVGLPTAVIENATRRLLALAPAAAGAPQEPPEDRHVARLARLLADLGAQQQQRRRSALVGGGGQAAGLSGDAPTRSGRWPVFLIHDTAAAVQRAACVRGGPVEYELVLRPRYSSSAAAASRPSQRASAAATMWAL